MSVTLPCPCAGPFMSLEMLRFSQDMEQRQRSRPTPGSTALTAVDPPLGPPSSLGLPFTPPHSRP
eukprot:1493001-Pleurochrysis_carterae.AAC.5